MPRRRITSNSDSAVLNANSWVNLPKFVGIYPRRCVLSTKIVGLYALQQLICIRKIRFKNFARGYRYGLCVRSDAYSVAGLATEVVTMLTPRFLFQAGTR